MPHALTKAGPVCTACGYNLRGLPTRGRCPECGGHYWSSTPEMERGVGRTLATACQYILEFLKSLAPSFWTLSIILLLLGATFIVAYLGSVGLEEIRIAIWGEP